MHDTKTLTPAQSVHRKFLWIRQVCSDPGLRHLSCRVAALLLDYINLKAQVAWPSQQTLASAAGVTPRAIQSALRCLERSGHITVRRLPGRVNRYRPRLANGRSPAPPEPLNSGSRTDERAFTRFHETPLNKSGTDVDHFEIGRQMRDLAVQLGGRPASGRAVSA